MQLEGRGLPAYLLRPPARALYDVGGRYLAVGKHREGEEHRDPPTSLYKQAAGMSATVVLLCAGHGMRGGVGSAQEQRELCAMERAVRAGESRASTKTQPSLNEGSRG
jgi:hypothetical protein